MEELIKYFPIIIMVVGFLVQHNVFVRPDKLEEKHRLILEDVRKEFASKDTVTDLKGELKDIKTKIDKIYDLIKGK